MVSSTQQTETIRKRKARKRCKAHPAALKRRQTPVFPIHPDNNAPTAANAEGAAQSAEQ